MFDIAYFATPYFLLCSNYSNSASNGTALSFDVKDFLDEIISMQYLMFYVNAEGDSADFYEHIRFGLMQGYTYIEGSDESIISPAVFDSETGKYKKVLAIAIKSLNAFDYTKPATFIATPQWGSGNGETKVDVNFSLYK